MSGQRQAPFYCPYCGEEDLVPAGPEGGGWDCRSCSRSFTLHYLGIAAGRTQAGNTEGVS